MSYFILGSLTQKREIADECRRWRLPEGFWFRDRGAHTQEEIDALNEAFRLVGQHDPRWLKLIWDIKVDAEPELRRVK